MRLAVVSLRTAHHSASAANERLDGLARRLAGRGHDVTVYTTQWWGGHEVRREVDGVRYEAIAPGPENRRTFLFRLPFEIQRRGADVIHAAGDPPAGVLSAGVAGSLARAPLVLEWYGDGTTTARRFAGRAVSRADAIVVPSRLVRTRLRELGADEDAVSVIPNPVDFGRIRSIDPAEDGGDIVYARHLDEAANLESLLLALAELRGGTWSATIVGDGPRRREYERQVADLRIDDQVAFVGECSLDRRIAIYRNAHAFVQTAEECAFATELCWALSCGCIGIVEYHADSSAHELVEGRDRGFRITDPEALAQALRDARNLEHMAVDESMDGYDEDVVLERYLDTYRQLQAAYGLF